MLQLLAVVVGVFARLGVVGTVALISGTSIFISLLSSVSLLLLIARWKEDKYRNASELYRFEAGRPVRTDFGFHSVGSRSDLNPWLSVGILVAESAVEGVTPVGVRGCRIGRGEDGVAAGGGEADMMLAADRGLFESLRRQASLQYRMEFEGVDICLSHMALCVSQ